MKQKRKLYWKAIKENTRFLVIVAIVEIGLIILGVQLLRANLLDVRTIISVLITEMGIGIILYCLLGQKRRSQIDEVVNLTEAYNKFKHLEVYTFSVFPFSVTFYYVANTLTKQFTFRQNT